MNRQWLYIVSKTNTISGLSFYRMNKLKLRNFSCLRMLHSMIDMRSMSSYPSNFNFISRLKFCFFFIYAFHTNPGSIVFIRKSQTRFQPIQMQFEFDSRVCINVISFQYHTTSYPSIVVAVVNVEVILQSVCWNSIYQDTLEI